MKNRKENNMNNLFEGEEYKYLFLDDLKQSLNDKFIIPPFSVFDTRQGYWQERKDKWKGLGIKSEIGRDNNLAYKGDLGNYDYFGVKDSVLENGTSIFDPVLCEICYKWFNIRNGKILDPFAGGSVRGIVANVLGYNYTGIDLSEKQIKANYDNANELNCNMDILNWINDDSNNVDNYIEDNSMDMIFTCPPYFDLEVYSKKENDLSNMNYDDFKISYKNILKKCCKKLKNNRFGIVVISDVRDKKGYYRNLIDLTKEAFIESGVGFYNDIILLNSVGTARLRANMSFTSSRKVVKIHQNVLVFYKGDQKEIKNNYKEVDN